MYVNVDMSTFAAVSKMLYVKSDGSAGLVKLVTVQVTVIASAVYDTATPLVGVKVALISQVPISVESIGTAAIV